MKLHKEKHQEFIRNHDKCKDTDLAYWMTEHLRVSGYYWGLTSMALLSSLDEMPKEDILQYILSCQHPTGNDHLSDQLSFLIPFFRWFWWKRWS
jgi:geranylgeranyl transferase type-2 subunit beta